MFLHLSSSAASCCCFSFYSPPPCPSLSLAHSPLLLAGRARVLCGGEAMKDAGELAKFQKNLDPQAQEFRPRNPSSTNQLVTPFHPHICYAYPFSYVSTPVISQACPAAGNPLPPPAPGPTRVVLLSCVPTDVSEAEVRMEMEGFGEVGCVEMERVWDGIVVVHFYDLRHAEEAVMEIQDQYMQQQSRARRFYEYDALLFGHLGMERQGLVVPVTFPARGLIGGRAVWAQFLPPESATSTPGGHNQGALVISILDSKLSASKLKEILQSFGMSYKYANSYQYFVRFLSFSPKFNCISCYLFQLKFSLGFSFLFCF